MLVCAETATVKPSGQADIRTSERTFMKYNASVYFQGRRGEVIVQTALLTLRKVETISLLSDNQVLMCENTYCGAAGQTPALSQFG